MENAAFDEEEERQILQLAEIKRKEFSILQKLNYCYPPKFINGYRTKLGLPLVPLFKKRCNESFNVIIEFYDYHETIFMPVHGYTTAKQLLKLAHDKITEIYGGDVSLPTMILKVLHKDEYIYEENMLATFEYISHIIERKITPILTVVPITDIVVPSDEELRNLPVDRTSKINEGETDNLEKVVKLSVEVDKNFEITLGNLRLDSDANAARIELGIFHGQEVLTETKEIILVNPKKGIWCIDKTVSFPIFTGDLPRMAKLCLVIFQLDTNEDFIDRELFGESSTWKPIAWVNTLLFDSNNILKTNIKLCFWNYDESRIHNPTKQYDDLQYNDVTFNCFDNDAAITMTASINQNSEWIIVYPNLDQIIKFLGDNEDHNLVYQREKYIKAIEKITTGHVDISLLTKSEKRDLWSGRNHLTPSQLVQLLPKLLQCVDWSNRYRSAEAMILLKNIPPLPSLIALQLLDCHFVDQEVRSFAVKCLESMDDGKFLVYLMQLVQFLKYEASFPSDLSNMILSRAKRNDEIGNWMFWHLCSEMSTTSMSLYLGLVLEDYFRINPKVAPVLIRQKDFLEKLEIVNLFVKMNIKGDKKQFEDYMKQRLEDEERFEGPLTNPLKPGVILGGIKLNECRVMNSKARPILLTFKNADNSNEDCRLIFKSGDNMKQDMLILQLLKIIDTMWKDNGFDMSMTMYGCCSTSSGYGLIEVVNNAETISSIQKSSCCISATSAFRKGSLYEWLVTKCSSSDALSIATDNFTNSCAGCSVTTFVLGIADRHPDNIMLKPNGQLFHIDFGHILGNFKKKYGLRRERVPFVLTKDMVHTICKGSTDEPYRQMRRSDFQEVCEELYLILHRNSDVILSLLTTMISSNLPELSYAEDLNYVHKTLNQNLTEAEAKEYFSGKFHDSLKNSWKTSLNWASHNIRRRACPRYLVEPVEEPVEPVEEPVAIPGCFGNAFSSLMYIREHEHES